MSTRPGHKLIFALVIIIVILLIALAMYTNDEYVAKERGLSIMADFNIGWKHIREHKLTWSYRAQPQVWLRSNVRLLAGFVAFLHKSAVTFRNTEKFVTITRNLGEEQ